MRPMTSKQEALILSLARQIDGGNYRFVTDADHLLPISRSAARGMTSTDASLCIDHLKDELKRIQDGESVQAAAPAPVEGAPTAEEAIAMLGKKVSIGILTKTDEADEREGVAESIELSDLDGTPALKLRKENGRASNHRLSRITGWTVIS